MMTIGILTFVLVGTSVSVAVEGTTHRPKTRCEFSKDSKGYLVADCAFKDLTTVPEISETDVQSLDLRHNYIGKLNNDSFDIYPNIRRLLLSYNRVHTVEPDSLVDLAELETLDLTQNAIKEVPAGLPKSLRRLYLGGNPVTDFRNLAHAVGLNTLVLKSCELTEYPALGLLPSLVELDVSDNERVDSVDPVQMATTCRLAHLNVTGTELFPAGRPGSHCRCRRAVEWALTYKIKLIGMGQCPDPADGEGDGGDDDPKGENCAKAPDAARAAFKSCMAEWEHRNTPYWAICSGLFIAAALVFALCVCLRRRRRRRADKGQGGVPVDTKDNNGAAAAAAVDAAGNRTEPAALLSSS